jgi:Flp pilus assembly pilin Flp
MKVINSEEGVTVIEYVLISVGIGMAIIVVVAAIGSQVRVLYQSVADAFK